MTTLKEQALQRAFDILRKAGSTPPNDDTIPILIIEARDALISLLGVQEIEAVENILGTAIWLASDWCDDDSVDTAGVHPESIGGFWYSKAFDAGFIVGHEWVADD